MKKRNKKKINKLFQNRQTQQKLIGNFYDICQDFLPRNAENNFQNLNADQSFALAVISKANANHVVTRQAILNLLCHIGENISPLINEFIINKNSLSFTESLSFLQNLNFSNHIHPYLVIIKGFIESASSIAAIESYFNCFMGKSTKYDNSIPRLNVKNLHPEIINNFYEITHRILSIKKPNKLKEFTFFIYKIVKDNASQSILFFMNYFTQDKSNQISFAHLFLTAKNYSITDYSQSLAYNTCFAAIDLERFEEANYWLKKINNSEKYMEIENYLLNKKQEIEEISQHPLNPVNISPLSLENISTIDLIFLCIYLDSCGDNWGLKSLHTHGQYTFPYYKTTLEILKSLAIKKLIKIPITSFTNYSLRDLNQIDKIIEYENFHLNIQDVPDSKILALKILLDEISNRIDKAESCYEIWKKIVLDYFFSALKYHLNNLRNSWAKDFELNEKIISDLSLLNLSAKILSYIAKNSTTYAAGMHAKGNTSGNQHTCNLLFWSINNHLEWIKDGNFIDKSHSRGKQPIFSSENILKIIAKISLEDIYNTNPNIDLIYTNISKNE